ncbi:opsin 8, group member a isoform X2 [Sphaeramia orbicularis]|uniref:opsin 8, group member a isoform X2 n=1 Tax=Sphaeramia orbicularis TaxID=375764 RepID=UPI00117FBB69|nr:opsin-5-like isoform X2 [Sphaeramia orbicularis]
MDEKYMSKLSPTVDFWAGVYLLIIVVSVFGNAAVLVHAARRLMLLKAPELLTVNLAVTDIGMALSMYPLSIASAFNHAWIGGDTSCLYYGLMGMIFSVTSIMTLAVMGMVRYLVTGSPPRTGIKFQRRTINCVISGIWLYAGLWALLPVLGWGSYGPEPFGLACSIDWIGYQQSTNHSTFIMSLSVLCTFIPFTVILFTYFGIAWKLHRAYQSIQSNDFHYGNIEKKITLMAVMISSGFLIAWTPYVAVSFWSMFHTKEHGPPAPFITLLPCLFAKSSTAYNPFIYFIFQRASRQELSRFRRRVLCCCCKTGGTGGEKAKQHAKMAANCNDFENGADETCVGLMVTYGAQSSGETMTQG